MELLGKAIYQEIVKYLYQKISKQYEYKNKNRLLKMCPARIITRFITIKIGICFKSYFALLKT